MSPCPLLLAVALAHPVGGTVPANAIPDESPVQLGIGLRLGDQAGLAALLARQQDRASPDYHRWLTPQEFGSRFGQPVDLYERAARWLQSAGFAVTRFPNRIFLEAQGTSGQVTRALGVHLAGLDGFPRSVHVPDRPAAFPAFLGGSVVHVAGLDTHLQFRHRLTGSNGQPSLGPQDLRRFYDSQPLLDRGFVGQGQKLVVLSLAEAPGNGPNVEAIQYFLRNISDSSADFVQDVLPNTGQDFDQLAGGGNEFSLDVEMQSVGSPGAESITLVVSPASQVFTTGVNHIVNALSTATAVSISLGTCEPAIKQGDIGLATSFQQLLEQGLSEGQTWSAASGDNGSDDCGDGMTESVDFPASIPQIVAAGGSEVSSPSWNAAGALTAYQTETVWWTDPNGAAGGGGFSILYGVPSYQQGFSFSGRSVPDISLIAGTPGVLYDFPLAGELFPIGGTSVASPLSAGFFGLIASRVGCRLGDVHRTLYTLGNAQLDGGAQVFHDIVSGTVALDGVPGPSAGPGYDSASGWGSLDVQALAEAWPSCGDAGVAGAPYAPCDACDGGTVCDTLTDGPSSCVIGCDPSSTGLCPLGAVCNSNTLFSGDGGVCAPGCTSDADCADGGEVCSTCDALCIAPGEPGTAIGAACNTSSECPSGSVCSGGHGLTGNYCTQACVEGESAAEACGCPAGSVCGQIGVFNQSVECLKSCPEAGQPCSRRGYLCQPIVDGNDACLPACQLVTFMGTTYDTCTQSYGSSLACDPSTGYCSLVVDAGPGDGGSGAADAGDAGIDGGRDAGADSGPAALDSGIADSGPVGQPDSGAPAGDGGRGTLASGGCNCSAGAAGGDALWGILGLAVFVRRRRAGRGPIGLGVRGAEPPAGP